jgi:hypothetical protein
MFSAMTLSVYSSLRPLGNSKHFQPYPEPQLVEHHGVVVNETPKLQCFKPTDLSHSINVRGDDMEDILVIPLELHGVVSFFTMFNPSQEEFDTCDRYELTF